MMNADAWELCRRMSDIGAEQGKSGTDPAEDRYCLAQTVKTPYGIFPLSISNPIPFPWGKYGKGGRENQNNKGNFTRFLLFSSGVSDAQAVSPIKLSPVLSPFVIRYGIEAQTIGSIHVTCFACRRIRAGDGKLELITKDRDSKSSQVLHRRKMDYGLQVQKKRFMYGILFSWWEVSFLAWNSVIFGWDYIWMVCHACGWSRISIIPKYWTNDVVTLDFFWLSRFFHPIILPKCVLCFSWEKQ